MFNNFIQRISPMILSMIASSGIARPRTPRIVSYGGPQQHFDLQGSGETLVRVEKKVGRNDPCSCGSGKKSKHCCGG